MPNPLTPWERLVASAHLEEVDFVQCYLPMRGVSYKRGVEIDLAKRYPESINAIRFRGLPGQPDPSIFGAKMDSRNPSAESDWWEPVIKSEEDYDLLEVPDLRAILHRKILPLYERRYEKMPDALKGCEDSIASCSILGPMDFASEMRGYDRLLADLLRCPQKVHRLFDLITRVNIEWIEICQEILGELGLLTLADHGLTFLSPRLYPSVLPYWQREFSAAPKDAIKWYHNEGNVTHVLEVVPEMGAEVFHLGWVDLGLAKQRIGDRVCLCGNLNTTSLLLRGSPEDVYKAAKKALEVAAPGGGFILSSSGGMAPSTPVENVDIMYKVATKEGRYPLPKRVHR
ncbi:MAG: uroporphyrinogen decarboxylase family protein [Candidatus Bathyarchaeia archaeon]